MLVSHTCAVKAVLVAATGMSTPVRVYPDVCEPVVNCCEYFACAIQTMVA